jgi:hypothetical protein
LSEWEVTVNFPMAWLPDISGEIRAGGDKTQIDIPISDILDHLDAGFIGELYVARGPWGLGWRSMYLNTASSAKTEAITGLPGRPPIVGRHRIEVENELFTSDLVGSYAFNEQLALYAGVRRTGNKTRLKVRPLEPGLVEIERRITIVDEELYDWVLGATLQHEFARRWAAVLQGDVGVACDNDRNQLLNAFLSYDFSSGHSLWFGYRYLQIRNSFRDGSGGRVKTDFTQQGPTLGWAWRF